MRNLVGVAVVLLLLVRIGDAGEAGKPVRSAVKRAVDWLDANLGNLPEAGGTPLKPFTYGVAGLVFLITGDPVDEVRDYLVDWVARVARRARDEEQLPECYGSFSSKRLAQYTWPLGQAALFFSELYERGRGRAGSKRVLTTIRDLLLEAQEADGGWGHGRVRSREKTGYPATLLAASNCAAAGLGAIEMALGRRSVDGLDAARRYYRTARLRNGNFPYDPSQRSAGRDLTGVSRTGGALLAMHYLGVPHDGSDFAASLRFLLKRLDYASEGHGSSMLNLAHTALALKAVGDEEFDRFAKLYVPRILAHQSAEGDLDCVCEDKAFATTCDRPRAGLPGVFVRTKKAYVTSLLTLVLLLDRDRLEILKKKPVKAPPRGEATESPIPRERRSR